MTLLSRTRCTYVGTYCSKCVWCRMFRAERLKRTFTEEKQSYLAKTLGPICGPFGYRVNLFLQDTMLFCFIFI